MDEYVIDRSFLFRWFLVNVCIVPKRKWTSSKAYQAIWTQNGSPLLLHSKNFSQGLQARLSDKVKVQLSMRYGSPSILEALKELKETGCDQVFVQSLYPHHTLSTMETAHKQVLRDSSKIGFQMDQLRFLPEFFMENFFLQPLAHRMKSFLKERKKEGVQIDHFVFSYHGLPKRHLRKLDPQGFCSFNTCCSSFVHPRCYRAQCMKTSELLCRRSGWDVAKSSTSFQSRLGQDWIPPYTVDLLQDLKKRGVKNLAVVTPSFLADCLETLEEVNIQLKEDFLEGRKDRQFFPIPCLNDEREFVNSFADYLEPWLFSHPRS